MVIRSFWKDWASIEQELAAKEAELLQKDFW
jgi:hypothetical protein